VSTVIAMRFAPRAFGSANCAVDHSEWHRLLAIYVKPGQNGLNRVDYAGLKLVSARLTVYITHLERTDVTALARDEQFAFWANLYNALTVRVIADHYPITSIRDIALGGALTAVLTGGPWKAKLAKVCGLDLSLDDIEHTILRGQFQDPRLHYAINCGSVGCPNLRIQPFTGSGLEVMLDAAASDFINSPRGMAIENSRIILSGIFKWYRRDFGGNERAVLLHIIRYADAPRREAIERRLPVGGYDYDWRLNDAHLPSI
jgi:hypothetical protein